jgi:hypothetical protein
MRIPERVNHLMGANSLQPLTEAFRFALTVMFAVGVGACDASED